MIIDNAFSTVTKKFLERVGHKLKMANTPYAVAQGILKPDADTLDVHVTAHADSRKNGTSIIGSSDTILCDHHCMRARVEVD